MSTKVNKNQPVVMGCKGRDIITGFVGIVAGECYYLTGCRQFLLSPSCDKNGEIKAGQWFDDKRIENVGLGVDIKATQTGGPQTDAPVRY